MSYINNNVLALKNAQQIEFKSKNVNFKHCFDQKQTLDSIFGVDAQARDGLPMGQ